MTLPKTPDLDGVLEAFASEPSTDDAVLAAYIRRYPEFALALADFAHDLRLSPIAEENALAPDGAWQAESWRRFENAATAMSSVSSSPITDPFAGVGPARLAEIRRDLNIPTAVLNGFRDRLVLAASVPRRFLARLADALSTGLDQFQAFLELPPRVNRAASYRADAAPGVGDEKITFEVLLDQAMVTPERRRALMQEQD
jgi:hypothetical protein